MKFLIHNKMTITVSGKNITFFNQMLNSVYDKIENFESYFNNIAFGTGTNSNIETTYKLASHAATYVLTHESNNSDLKNGILYSKKCAVISDSKLDNKQITEAGITSSFKSNPTIYNYFSLKNDEYPNGITKKKGETIEISICIYLTIQSESIGLLTAGDNPFINFLLGEGIGNKKFYAVRGDLYLDNSLINREKPNSKIKFACSLNSTKNNGLTLSIYADMLSGETHEIVLLIGDEPFARINTENEHPPISKSNTFTPKTNYVIDLGQNVNSVTGITNQTSNAVEGNVFYRKYANDFGDKISLPFNDLFDSETPRFLSKDGDKIFFVLDDTIYAYYNKDYRIEPIETNGASMQNIFKIIAFDKYVFVFAKTDPFYSFYVIKDNKIIKSNLNFSNFAKFNELQDLVDIDITQGRNNLFMMGYIPRSIVSGVVVYFNYDESTNTFVYDIYTHALYNYSHVLAMYKNNFSDAMLIFLIGNEHSYDCKIVTYYPDKTVTDVYSVVCYYYTNGTKEIYTKGRAIVVEKTTNPHLWVYFYPQVYRYNLEILGDELDDYVSTNMLYLIQKKTPSQYEIYNLVGYNTPTKFLNGLPSEIDQSKIEGFEFLNDTLLIFLSDEKNRVCAYNLKEDCMLIENVSSNTDSYLVTYKQLDLPGSNNEGVVVTMTININI